MKSWDRTGVAAIPAERAREVYRSSIVIDGSIAPVMDEGYIRRLKASGVTAVNWTVCSPWIGFTDALAEIAQGLEIVADHPLDLLLARVPADIEDAKRTGRVAVIFGPQNGALGEAGPFAFRILHEVGVRIIQLTYNERNAYGTGAGEAEDTGVTEAGHAAIAEMDRLGIVLDLSHCGDRTTLEAIESCANPALMTHVNARALHPSARNKTDEHLRALARRGGVAGVTLWSPMLRSDRRPTLDDFVRHVAYMGELIGIEHVAIGTDHSEGTPREDWGADFGAGGRYPRITAGMGSWYTYDTRFTEGGSAVDDVPGIAEAIARLGLTADELAGVLGGNLMRVLRQVWGD